MKDGYYWVKYGDSWEILWRGKYGFIVDDYPLYESELEIGDYIETPEKYKG